MTHIITAVYEKGVLRPLSPLPLAEQQIVQLHILPADEAGPIIQALVVIGLLTPPPGATTLAPVAVAERQALADRLGQAATRPLSEVIMAERDQR